MMVLTYLTEVVDGAVIVWAESEALPGFSAAGASIDEVRALVAEYLRAEGRGDESWAENLGGQTESSIAWWVRVFDAEDSLVGGSVVKTTKVAPPSTPEKVPELACA